MTAWYQTGRFYDRIAERIERYTPEQRAAFRATPDGLDPEARFTALVKRSVGPDDIVLDIGTGDGSWLIANVVPLAATVIGLDNAGLRLRQAGESRQRQGARNCCFALADGESLPLPDEAVTVLINRRGPLTASDAFFSEGCRVLAQGGLMVEIGIGERNMQEIDAAFGSRSQMHDDLTRGSVLEQLMDRHRSRGVEPETWEDIVAAEYFPSREALEYRFLTTPIIAGFNPVSDSALVDELVARNQAPAGIRMTLHRPVLIARKAM